MASIIITANAAPAYALASDDVFGPPASFTYQGKMGRALLKKDPKKIIKETRDLRIFSYPGGRLTITRFWYDQDGTLGVANMVYSFGEIIYSTEAFFPGVNEALGKASAYEIRTDGIIYKPNKGIEITDSIPTSSTLSDIPGGIRSLDPDYPAYALSGADVIANHSAKGAEMKGYGGDDTLTGGLGPDTLDGGAGDDVLGGVGGADHFRFDGPKAGLDKIMDFNPAQDVIEISASGFKLTGLAKITFVVDGAPLPKGGATVIYYANGDLAFDADGGFPGVPVVFASLKGHPKLTAANLSTF